MGPHRQSSRSVHVVRMLPSIRRLEMRWGMVKQLRSILRSNKRGEMPRNIPTRTWTSRWRYGPTEVRVRWCHGARMSCSISRRVCSSSSSSRRYPSVLQRRYGEGKILSGIVFNHSGWSFAGRPAARAYIFALFLCLFRGYFDGIFCGVKAFR